MSNELPIPPGWRRVAVGEPLPADAKYWSIAFQDWKPSKVAFELAGDIYRADWSPMITQSTAHYSLACGIIDVGTDR